MQIRIQRCTILLIATFIVGCANAENDPLSTYLNWKKGDSFDYLITKKRESLTPDGFVTNTAVQTDTTLTVTDRAQDQYKLDWIIGNTIITAGPDIHNPMAQEFANTMKGFTIKLLVDEAGTLTDIENFDELKAKADKFMDEVLIAQISQGKLEQNQAERLKQAVMRIYDSKEMMMTTALPEMAVLFAPHGYSFSETTELTGDVEFPNPFGAEPIPATGTVTLAANNADNNELEVVVKQAPDAAELKRIMLQTFITMAKQQGSPEPTADEMPDMTFTNSAKYVLDRTTKVVKFAESAKTIDLGVRAERDTMAFQLK